MNEQRVDPRNSDVCIGVSCFAKLAGGEVHEGVVRDVSDGGAKISSEITGVSVGQQIALDFAIRGEKIGYSATVVYVSDEENIYGVKFLDGPHPIGSGPTKSKRCIKCDRLYDTSLNYCSTCGSDLTQPRIY
jgi:hypothetical protein